MSGIPVYTKSPINAAKAAGVTPQTAAPQVQSASNPVPTPTIASNYQKPQPGAVLPGPTSTVQRYAPPVQPTPTSQIGQEGPPAPQPGAVPTLPGRTTIAPPPKAGETYRPEQTGGAAAAYENRQSYPPQWDIPPPTSAYQPTRSTTTASASYPVAIDEAPRRSLEHPPGYQQNAYASELSSDQRRAQEANTSRTEARDISGGGGMDLLNTARIWAQHAGEKIVEAEAEVWRKINKEQ